MTPEMEQRFNHLCAEVSAQTKDLTAIKLALLGDNTYKQKGLIEELEDAKKRIRRLEYLLALCTGAFTAIGVLYGIARDVAPHLIK